MADADETACARPKSELIAEVRKQGTAMTWEQLAEFSAPYKPDGVNGPCNSISCLRLFGRPEEEARVVLYRDTHAWCPYCQKVWLWLEEKKIPYVVRKVSMSCYSEKEKWYTEKVPSGMLPAIEIDGDVVVDSDDVIVRLEAEFGALHTPFADPAVLQLRKLERQTFSAWCRWLCYPAVDEEDEEDNEEDFEKVMDKVEALLGVHEDGPYFFGTFSVADVVFTPYFERISASLVCYKGYLLRLPEQRPRICAWFEAMEARPTYRGMQSDFVTHIGNLPPQMGGCFESKNAQQQRFKKMTLLFEEEASYELRRAESSYEAPPDAREEAVSRLVRHHTNVTKANVLRNKEVVDEAIRCGLTTLCAGVTPEALPVGADVALRFVRNSINVPRDMSLWAARLAREAFEATAAKSGTGQPPPAPLMHRRDQDPRPFANSGKPNRLSHDSANRLGPTPAAEATAQ